MARTIQLKTAKEVEQVAKLKSGKNFVEPGLYLQVNGSAVSWLHRYAFKGKSRWSGLGSYPELSLAGARAKLKDEQAKIRAGVDPVAARKAERAAKAVEHPKKKTFLEVAEDYIATHESRWTNPKHRNQWIRTLQQYAHPFIGHMPVDEITTENGRQVLQPIWRVKPETARRLRGRCEKVLSFAKRLGLRAGENPFRWSDNIEHIFPRLEKKRKVHHAAMAYNELPGFLVKLREQGGLSARALEFLILTAVRTGDIIGGDREERPAMMWGHVDLAGALWTIPATKNDSEHKVPLSTAAIAVLESVKALSVDRELVFPSPGKGPLSNNAMRALMERMGHGDVTVHGFRSTFRDWAAECTNFPRELCEKALAHTIGDETQRVYQRGDLLNKRRKLMEAWAGYCTRPATAQVVPLHKAAN